MSRVDEWLAQRGAADLLYPAGVVYERLMSLRNALYDRGVLMAERLGVPVVSIGNLTAGGTGKTPMVAWCAAELLRRNLHVAKPRKKTRPTKASRERRLTEKKRRGTIKRDRRRPAGDD